jgi:hypothetical protein
MSNNPTHTSSDGIDVLSDETLAAIKLAAQKEAQLPHDDSLVPTIALSRSNWWEAWWMDTEAGGKNWQVDTEAIKELLDEGFDPDKPLGTYISESGHSVRFIDLLFFPSAARNNPPSKSNPKPPPRAKTIEEGFAASRSLSLQKPPLQQSRDVAFQLGVLLKSAKLKSLGQRGIPIAALSRRIPDTLAAQIRAFRAGNIAPVSILGPDAAKVYEDASAATARNDARAREATSSKASGVTEEERDREQRDLDESAALALELAAGPEELAAALRKVRSARDLYHETLKGKPSSPAAIATIAAKEAWDNAVSAQRALEESHRYKYWRSSGAPAAWMNQVFRALLSEAGDDQLRRRIAACFEQSKLPLREGMPDAIVSYDGTVTWGSGWNMTSGDGAQLLRMIARPDKAGAPKDGIGYAAACRALQEYLWKCGIYFDAKPVNKQVNLAIVHLEERDGGVRGWVVTNDEDIDAYGAAFSYMQRNRTILEAFGAAGREAKLPDQFIDPASPPMPINEAAHRTSHHLFYKIRHPHFVLHTLVKTQAAFFALAHMNHFGSIYHPDRVIMWGIMRRLIPVEIRYESEAGAELLGANTALERKDAGKKGSNGRTDDPADVDFTRAGPKLKIRRCAETDVAIVRAAMSWLHGIGGYGTGNSFFRTMWTYFIQDLSGDGLVAELGEKGFTPGMQSPFPILQDVAKAELERTGGSAADLVGIEKRLRTKDFKVFTSAARLAKEDIAAGWRESVEYLAVRQRDAAERIDEDEGPLRNSAIYEVEDGE